MKCNFIIDKCMYRLKDFAKIILVNCLNDIQFDQCVALKQKIAEQPDFEIFDKVQEIMFSIREFIFKVTDNLETKIDKIESLYLSR